MPIRLYGGGGGLNLVKGNRGLAIITLRGLQFGAILGGATPASDTLTAREAQISWSDFIDWGNRFIYAPIGKNRAGWPF